MGIFEILLTTTVVSSVSGFLLDDDCPVSSPCFCTQSSIECGFQHLNHIPVFRNATFAMQGKVLFVNFAGNAISTLPANAFVALKNIDMFEKETQMDFSNNSLTTAGIDDYAFNSIEGKISYLDLSHNNITTLPGALSKLQQLKTLYLESNPISSFENSKLINFEQVLKNLSFSFNNLLHWPAAFHQLTALEYLKLTDISFDLPLDAFKGFTLTLKHLIFQHAEFNIIPAAVCELKVLQSLNITFDGSLTGKTVVHCNPALTTVKTLMFSHDGNRYLPNIFQTFPNVEDVFINDSRIEFIDDTFSSTYIKRLTISNSKLSAIPGAINHFTNLQFLDLHGNEIRSIEANSLATSNLANLMHLSLQNNPIIYISNTAFYNLNKLVSLDLRNTRLTAIPGVVQRLTALKFVDLRHNSVTCNCDSPWLKSWSSRVNTLIFGNCETTNQPIWLFMNQTLPNCP